MYGVFFMCVRVRVICVIIQINTYVWVGTYICVIHWVRLCWLVGIWYYQGYNWVKEYFSFIYGLVLGRVCVL